MQGNARRPGGDFLPDRANHPHRQPPQADGMVRGSAVAPLRSITLLQHSATRLWAIFLAAISENLAGCLSAVIARPYCDARHGRSARPHDPPESCGTWISTFAAAPWLWSCVAACGLRGVEANTLFRWAHRPAEHMASLGSGCIDLGIDGISVFKQPRPAARCPARVEERRTRRKMTGGRRWQGEIFTALCACAQKDRSLMCVWRNMGEMAKG